MSANPLVLRKNVPHESVGADPLHTKTETKKRGRILNNVVGDFWRPDNFFSKVLILWRYFWLEVKIFSGSFNQFAQSHHTATKNGDLNFFYYVFQCKSIENSWRFWGWKLKKMYLKVDEFASNSTNRWNTPVFQVLKRWDRLEQY